MSTNKWLPLGTEPGSAHLYEGLHEGVPPWMKKALIAWLEAILRHEIEDEGPGKILHEIERGLRSEIYVRDLATYNLVSYVLSHFTSMGQELLLTDYMLSRWDIESLGGEESAAELIADPTTWMGTLEETLSESGSAWRVGLRYPDAFGLIKRVPEGVQSAADTVMTSGGHAGKTLAKAWGEAFGHNPNPREAYRLAVEAVEDAAIPHLNFTPAENPTLGSVIRKINGSKRDAGEWTLPLQREDDHYSNGQTVVAMLKSLWAGQVDRHGGEQEHHSKIHVEQAAAETAVLMAVPLVQWFTSGAVARTQIR